MAKKIIEQNTPGGIMKTGEELMRNQIHKNAVKSRDNLKKRARAEKAKEFELPLDNPQ
tara:strand:+ start:110 stop:283 length:174 start_codon:yes stop_codon:yes gene_type:complete